MFTFKTSALIYFVIAIWIMGFLLGTIIANQMTSDKVHQLQEEVEAMKSMNIYQP